MSGKPPCAIVAALALLLAGCSTDGMTPQAEVPGGGTETTERATVDEPRVRTATTARESEPLVDSDPPLASERAPQNTLEAQARAIEQGQDNPSLTRPREGNLGANLYKSDAEPQAVASLYATSTATGTIRFLPIIGAPVQAVTPLSKELGASARGNGLSIKASNDQTAEHALKGYLSAFADGGNITVVYVWDVLDNSGARLHRIQGQQTVKGSGGDAWTAVPPETMQQVGVATIAEYLRWRQSQG